MGDVVDHRVGHQELGHIDWPDFGVPADGGAVAWALRAVLERARSQGSGKVVNGGCGLQ
jgi:hypothetical protein